MATKPARAGSSSTVASITVFTCSGFNVGASLRMRAAVPATSGAANDVPDASPQPPITVVTIRLPGAARSTEVSPKLVEPALKTAGSSLRSVAATATMLSLGKLAG